jgi:molybdopterin-guanine dinucleotide biosynthesis protein A
MHYQNRVSDVTGVILAGGKSSRFGRNKAFALVRGIPLTERVAAVMGNTFEKVIIITNAPEEYRHLCLPMHEDLIKGIGPLGGIYTALSAMSTEWGFVTACDMPFLKQGLLLHMLSLRPGHDAVVPRVGWKIEPLHALYKKSCLKHIRDIIASGSYQVISSFSRVRVRYLESQEITPFDPGLTSFININRPEEIDAVLDIERGHA